MGFYSAFKGLTLTPALLVEEEPTIVLFFVALRPNASHGLLILEVSRSHTTTHHTR